MNLPRRSGVTKPLYVPPSHTAQPTGISVPLHIMIAPVGTKAFELNPLTLRAATLVVEKLAAPPAVILPETVAFPTTSRACVGFCLLIPMEKVADDDGVV